MSLSVLSHTPSQILMSGEVVEQHYVGNRDPLRSGRRGGGTLWQPPAAASTSVPSCLYFKFWCDPCPNPNSLYTLTLFISSKPRLPAPMPGSDDSKTRRVKEVTDLIRSQNWSFNDFLIAFYSSNDPSIATQRGRCLTKTDGARFALEELVDLWLNHCPSSSQGYLEHVIVDRASRIIIKETDNACALKPLCVSTTSVTADDLDENFLLRKLEALYTTTLPLLWFLLNAIVISPNRSEQQKQQTAGSKETRAKFVESLFGCGRPPTESFTIGLCGDREHPALCEEPRNKCLPNDHGLISWNLWSIKTRLERLQPYGYFCQL